MVFVIGELMLKYEIRAKMVLFSFKQPAYHWLKQALKRISEMVI